jgi:site-specific recombinase XerD
MTGDLKRMKEPHHLPVVLSKQEAFAMIDAAPNLKIKAVVAVFYSAGLRLEESTSLKLTDIDRSRMILRLHHRCELFNILATTRTGLQSVSRVLSIILILKFVLSIKTTQMKTGKRR